MAASFQVLDPKNPNFDEKRNKLGLSSSKDPIAIFEEKDSLQAFFASKTLGTGVYGKAVLYHTQAGSEVVIKVQNYGGLSEAYKLEAAKREAAINEIVHERGQIYIDSANKITYIAMKKLDPSLAALFFNRSPQVFEIFSSYTNFLKFFIQIMKSVNELHTEKKIAHRDIQHANISLSPDGKIQLLDFGNSRELEAKHGLAIKFPNEYKETNADTRNIIRDIASLAELLEHFDGHYTDVYGFSGQLLSDDRLKDVGFGLKDPREKDNKPQISLSNTIDACQKQLDQLISIENARNFLEITIKENKNSYSKYPAQQIVDILKNPATIIPLKKSKDLIEFIQLTQLGVSDLKKFESEAKTFSALIENLKDIREPQKRTCGNVLAGLGLMFLGTVVLAAVVGITALSYGSTTPLLLATLGWSASFISQGFAIIYAAVLAPSLIISGAALATPEAPKKLSHAGHRFLKAATTSTNKITREDEFKQAPAVHITR